MSDERLIKTASVSARKIHSSEREKLCFENNRFKPMSVMRVGPNTRIKLLFLLWTGTEPNWNIHCHLETELGKDMTVTGSIFTPKHQLGTWAAKCPKVHYTPVTDGWCINQFGWYMQHRMNGRMTYTMPSFHEINFFVYRPFMVYAFALLNTFEQLS